jgi:hypothetical protein
MRKREVVPSMLILLEGTKATGCIKITLAPILRPCKEQIDFVEKLRIIGNDTIEQSAYLEFTFSSGL